MKTPEFVGFIIGLLVWLVMWWLADTYSDPKNWFFWGAITGTICIKIWRTTEQMGKEARNVK